MALAVIPHELFGAECRGCLEMIIGTDTQYRCSHCKKLVANEDVNRFLLAMDSTYRTCTHCGEVNRVYGFSEASPFTCRYCGELVYSGIMPD